MSAVIQTEGLGKCYRVLPEAEKGGSVVGRLLRIAKSPFSHLGRMMSSIPPEEQHWALRDLTLSIDEGEIVALIGRNGAGKTTLLKLISRLTAPSEGRGTVRGRVASMLELGTGFHNDLTGRENIVVNGMIMGMTRREIAAKFDDIVEFSGVAKHLDTMVRFYSSGMYVRLAMGVSVHLSAEILLIDEILSVADQSFRDKSLAKIREVARSGRTVIFVSHNINSILQLCTRAVLLDKGRMQDDGPTAEIVQRYLSASLEIQAERAWPDRMVAPGFADANPEAADVVRLRAIRSIDGKGEPRELFDVREPVTIEVEYDVTEARFALALMLTFTDEVGRVLFFSPHDHGAEQVAAVGRHRVRATIPGDLLDDGRVDVSVAIETRPAQHRLEAENAMAFSVTDGGDSDGVRGRWVGPWPDSAVRPRIDWRDEGVEKLAD